MRIRLSYKHIFLETILVLTIAWFFSLFAKDFYFWLIVCLIVTLIWHHQNEFKLLEILYPQAESKKRRSILDYLSPSLSYRDRKTRKEKLQTLRLLSRLNKNVQYLPDGIIVCTQNGDISWCNNSAQNIFAFYWHKKAQKNIFSVIFYPEFKSYFQQQTPKRPLVLLTNDQRYIEINLNRYDTERYLVIMRDVTQIIRLLHSRQTFLSNMNHELRTPLTVLQGYLEILENEVKDNEIQHKAVESMLEQSQRMAKLLNQLSLLAKIEHSVNEHFVVDMPAIIAALQKNSQFLKNSHQKITFDIEPNLKIMGDESQLQSITSNLINNAIKHSGEHSHIHIVWQRCPEGAKFSVSDNGIGIDEKHISHLTERFYRVDESRNNQTGGSGLGLAIVKHALEQHNSTLDIESKPGKGSTFSFIIKKRYIIEED
ncbi:phosphate regulon sensor histidine kinase PhoR [Actinobacillus minor]|uniref:phosphate regulon sensor histidine kinase PhoR n=1 Tax=Actinobacillus minor TaxID=51047 RepID=UPI0026F30766|nr:phosphate regulon sensor histidine kinase PhoR [Actinobacillus minor]